MQLKLTVKSERLKVNSGLKRQSFLMSLVRYFLILFFFLLTLNSSPLTPTLAAPPNPCKDDSAAAATGRRHDNPCQNLYQNVYETLRDEGEEKAEEKVLEKFPLIKEELDLLKDGYSLGTVLVRPDPTTKLSPGDADKRRQEILAAYEEEKELAEFQVSLESEVQPTELFSNGDESDSGFDLITDLDIISFILFGREANIAGGGLGFGGDSSRSPSGISGGGADSQLPNAPFGIGGSGSGLSPATPPPPSSSTSGSPAGGDTETTGSDELCPINASFDAAVEEAQGREQGSGNSQQEGRGDGGQGEGIENREQGTGRDERTMDNDDDTEDEDGQLETATPFDWSIPRICGNIFCLKVEAIYKRESSYTVRDNCVACHVEKINDSFKRTFDHSVIPSKLTGNLIEPNVCKSAATNGWLSFNAVLVPQPILTPPNDDLVVKGDIAKNFAEFFEKYYSNYGGCHDEKGGVGGACKNPEPVETRIAGKILESANETTSQKKIVDDINTQVALKRAEALNLITQTKNATDAENKATQYSVMMSEIKAMQQYFESFVKLFENIVAPEDDSPCTVLFNKKTCT